MEQDLTLYLNFDKEALFEKNVIIFTKNSLENIIDDIDKDGREISKLKLNTIVNLVLKQDYSKECIAELTFIICSCVFEYAQIYKSTETFIRLLEFIKKQNSTSFLSNKYSYKYKIALAQCYLGKFNSLINENGRNNWKINDVDDLLNAKYYLYKLYLQSIGGKLKLDDNQHVYILNLLSAVLMQLSRWPEAIGFIEVMENEFKKQTNFKSYVKALTFYEMANKTCLDENSLLLTVIYEECNKVIKNENLFSKMQLNQIKETHKNLLERARKYNINIDDIIINKSKTDRPHIKINKLKTFLLNRNLYLNEHGLYCKCIKSTKDDLKVETSHIHTKKQWINNYYPILEDLFSEFTLSRLDLFHSLESNVRIVGVNSFDNKHGFKLRMRDSMLKSAFRRCYSILDSIANLILSVEKVDLNRLKKEGDKKIDIYFLNMWDLKLIPESRFYENRYLLALYSLSADLQYSNFAALKNFKRIRNAIEHSSLILIDGLAPKNNRTNCIDRNEFINNTMVLISLVRSAIFSTIYYFRIHSKLND